jgi:hypothetical protein
MDARKLRAATIRNNVITYGILALAAVGVLWSFGILTRGAPSATEPSALERPTTAGTTAPLSTSPAPAPARGPRPALTKAEQIRVLAELREIERRGRKAPRNTPLCLARMVDEHRRIREYVADLENRPMPGGTGFLQTAARNLTGCTDCSDDFVISCDAAREALNDANEEIKSE